jgi:hypothetical protein
MAGVPDPKPAKRIVDTMATRRVVRNEPRCRLCPKRARFVDVNEDGVEIVITGVTGHHLVKRSQQGDDVDDNIVPLCGSGTTGCHGEVERSREARSRLREKLTAANVAYCVAKKSQAWLDEHYPVSV